MTLSVESTLTEQGSVRMQTGPRDRTPTTCAVASCKSERARERESARARERARESERESGDPPASGPNTCPSPPQKSVVMRYMVAAWFCASHWPDSTVGPKTPADRQIGRQTDKSISARTRAQERETERRARRQRQRHRARFCRPSNGPGDQRLFLHGVTLCVYVVWVLT